MDRALNLDGLRLALGEGGMFPSPEELQERLGEAEIGLFLGQGSVADDLLATAWYLHAVGSVRPELQLYPIDRQIRANQVAAHIFDLALAGDAVVTAERLEMTFAGQIGYLRGGLHPNSRALYGRLPRPQPSMRDKPGEVSLDVGSSLLALDRRRLFPRLDALRTEADVLRRIVGVGDLIETPYGSAARVVEACLELLVHLTYNRPDRLGRARGLLDEAIDPPYAQTDLDSRWTAAHLRDIADQLGASSVWAHLPPTIPSAAGQAMTLGDPPVLSLWPPQLDLIQSTPNPLEPAVRRLLLSLPTSAGKTLIAEYIVAAHVASGAGSACVIVPTHSLAREVRRDLDRRLAIVARYAADAGPLGLALPQGAPVVVMTPEKLAAHLRFEPTRVLADYSLFLIDEAHLVGDRDRGWVLESALSFLHESTLESNHRIVLLSATIGNRPHIASWMSVAGEPAQTFHRDWRGPRRAHAIFCTDADWFAAQLEPPQGRVRLTRRRTPLYGSIHVRTGPGQYKSLRTTQSIGELVQVQREGEWKRDDDRTTRSYVMRAEIAAYLGLQGPVLVIEPTKLAAQRTAAAIANLLEDDPSAASLVALAATRVGEGHPLVDTLRRGVGFHHSALPGDVQAELEDALRTGLLRHLVTTTTLVEGINFPVRTVLIGDRGYRTAGGWVETLDAPRLLNAIGRAGRAGRETEGWAVLSLQKEFSAADFAELDASDDELQAVSLLNTRDALDALDAFEQLLREGEDAIMETAGNAVGDFISHVWFVATALEDLGRAAEDPVRFSMESTLAWQQLEPETQERWQSVADLAFSRYGATSEQRRRRWARTGTAIGTAAILESIAEEVRGELPQATNRSEPVSAFRFIAANGRLDRFLSLKESHFRPFRPRRNSPARDALEVDLEGLILDWLGGEDLSVLGQRYLPQISDENHRYEQLSEFVSQILEHLLPWLLGTVVTWVNDGLESDEQLCPELAAYVRHGVSSPFALELVVGGVRSRRLAQAAARLAADEAVEGSAREWLAGMDMTDWRSLWDAAPSELSDLLFFTRARDAQITGRVLAGEVVEVPVSVPNDVSAGPVALEELPEDAPARLGLWRGQTSLGIIFPQYHDDLSRLRAVGVPLVLELTAEQTLRIRILDPTERGAWFGRESAEAARDAVD